MTNQQHQESRWVLRAQTGDRDAMDRLLRAVQLALYGYLRRLTGDPAGAEDLLQDVFVLILRKIGWLQEPSLFRPWAYRIASRQAYRWLRKKRGWREQPLDESLATVLEAPQVAVESVLESRAELERWLEWVTPASRAVLILHYLHDLTLPEVAAVLELKLGTVKSRLAYGLASIRRRVESRDSTDRTKEVGRERAD